jgi:hypothetical protein
MKQNIDARTTVTLNLDIPDLIMLRTVLGTRIAQLRETNRADGLGDSGTDTREIGQPVVEEQFRLHSNARYLSDLIRLYNSLEDAETAKMADRDTLHNAMHEMDAIGGGFASALARAWFRADSNNKARIEAAFADLIKKFL